MNAASQWRSDMARRLVPHYAAYPHVEAVVLLGGAARGWADSYSDIDLVIYWREPPTEAERRAVIQTLGAHPGDFGDTFATQPDAHLRYWWEEYYLTGDADTGLKIDIGHHLSADMDAVIEAVTRHDDVHPLKHEMLYSIKRVQAFYGKDRVAGWSRAAGRCPESLARHLVEQNLRLPPFWMAAACIEREDWLLYSRILSEVGQRLLAAVVYLNREYYPGPKRQAYLLAELPIQPDVFNGRLNAVLRGDPREAPPGVYQLYDEVVALAQQHLPALNLDGAQAQFHYRRPRWDSPPTYLP
ncbi:MAG: nucleotidyltransferase domain-containing protein [Anaerolineae bacterium]|nr:nucleotidyltransferase domain-containing protein [Anaerolineae bacterium]